MKIKKVIGIGAEYSFLPNTSFAGAEIKFRGIAGDLRVFPFKGGLFIGFRAGKQDLDTRMSVSAGRLASTTESMSASTWFVNPRIGYLKTWDNGITVGIDAGLQVPVSPTYSRDGDATRAGISTDADKNLLAVANTLGNKMTPSVDLLRVGFLF